MKEVTPSNYLEIVKDGKIIADVSGLDGNKEFPCDKILPLTLGYEIKSTKYHVFCRIGKLIDCIR